MKGIFQAQAENYHLRKVKLVKILLILCVSLYVMTLSFIYTL